MNDKYDFRHLASLYFWSKRQSLRHRSVMSLLQVCKQMVYKNKSGTCTANHIKPYMYVYIYNTAQAIPLNPLMCAESSTLLAPPLFLVNWLAKQKFTSWRSIVVLHLYSSNLLPSLEKLLYLLNQCYNYVSFMIQNGPRLC